MRLPPKRIVLQKLERFSSGMVAMREASERSGRISPQASNPLFCLQMCDQLYPGDLVGRQKCRETCY